MESDLEVVNSTMMLDELLVIGSNLEYMKFLLTYTMGLSIMLFCGMLVLIAFVAKGRG